MTNESDREYRILELKGEISRKTVLKNLNIILHPFEVNDILGSFKIP
jgi:hypothetical protein